MYVHAPTCIISVLYQIKTEAWCKILVSMTAKGLFLKQRLKAGEVATDRTYIG